MHDLSLSQSARRIKHFVHRQSSTHIRNMHMRSELYKPRSVQHAFYTPRRWPSSSGTSESDVLREPLRLTETHAKLGSRVQRKKEGCWSVGGCGSVHGLKAGRDLVDRCRLCGEPHSSIPSAWRGTSRCRGGRAPTVDNEIVRECKRMVRCLVKDSPLTGFCVPTHQAAVVLHEPLDEFVT